MLDPPAEHVLVDVDDSATPPFIVTANGWAPPIPPAPAVIVSVPGQRAAEALRAISAKHSYVPCRIPCVPM